MGEFDDLRDAGLSRSIPSAVGNARATSLLVLLLLVCMTLGCALGPLSLWPPSAMGWQVLQTLRLPRVVAAALGGAALGVGGAALQAVFRNPLVEPGLLGVSAGAAVGAASVLVLGVGSVWTLAGGAFVGSLAMSVVLAMVGRYLGGGGALLLAGVAGNAFALALLGVLQALAPPAMLKTFAIWSLGGFDAVSWPGIAPLALAVAIALISLLGLGGRLNALALGAREAGHLGIDVPALEMRVLIVIALGVGATTALIGMLAFVGLIVPHLLRLLHGPDHRRLLPNAALLGAALLVLAELLARTVLAPRELPVGVLTSLIGGPVFLRLLWQHKAWLRAL